MSETTLRAETGRPLGTRPSRRLRREGQVPAVLYGKDADPIAIAVGARDLRHALGTEAGINAILNVEIDGKTHTVLAREVQRHPVRGEIIHLDFVKISLTDRVEATVHVEFVGDPIGVREDGGIVETVNQTVELSAVVTNIPDSIELDISELHVGESLKVEDLPALEGVEYLDDPELTLVTVSVPAAVLAGEGAEGEELAEGEEAPEGAAAEQAAAEAGGDEGSGNE